MGNNTDDQDRLRILNEIRAYGKAAPFAHSPLPRENIYDASMREWMRSRTFKTIMAVTCGLPLIAVCVVLAASTAAVLFGGYAVLGTLEKVLLAFGIGG